MPVLQNSAIQAYEGFRLSMMSALARCSERTLYLYAYTRIPLSKHFAQKPGRQLLRYPIQAAQRLRMAFPVPASCSGFVARRSTLSQRSHSGIMLQAGSLRWACGRR